MMGQETTTMGAEKVGGPLKRMILLLAVAAVMAATMAVSAGPASAVVIFKGDNDHHNSNFFDRNNDFEVIGPNFDDQELESGSIETNTDISIEGNNNNQCVGALQLGNTGNFSNQQGTTQFFSDGEDNEFEGDEISFAPENETECEQDVQQASAASSGWW